jgi:hypothetical protein
MKALSDEQMEQINGGMPCSVAVGLYVVGFVAGCAVPGAGWLAFAAAVTIAGTIWGVADNCKNVF